MISKKDIAKVEELPLKKQSVRIFLLDNDENILQEIQGAISAGSIKVTNKSSIRRTLNLTLELSEQNQDVINISNRIKIEMGYKVQNEMIWFPLGIFIILNKTKSINLDKISISISGQDKSALLDGHVGGVFPISAIIDEEKSSKEKVPLETVIYEIVTQFGGESPTNIFIEDLPKGKMLIKYVGSSPIYFNNDLTVFSKDINDFEEIEQKSLQGYSYGDDVGYMSTDLIYTNGELSVKTGESVKSALDKIVRYLGHFEYYYDVEGHFIFQRIRAYENILPDLKNNNNTDNNFNYDYLFDQNRDLISIRVNPTLTNLKNDFILWGKQKSANTASTIMYHVAIDEPPELSLANKFFYEKKDENGKIIEYKSLEQEQEAGKTDYTLIGKKSNDWREELYRQALVSSLSGDHYSYYDQELLSFWRQNYDTLNEEWKSNNWYNPNFSYWLDFITPDSNLYNYSIKKIGRRTIAMEDERIRMIFKNQVPDINFFYGNDEKAVDKDDKNAFQIPPQYRNEFVISTTGISAFERMQEILYQKLVFNTSLQVQSLPKYYLEPNKVVLFQDDQNKIYGRFIITDFTLPLTQSGSMQITLAEIINQL